MDLLSGAIQMRKCIIDSHFIFVLFLFVKHFLIELVSLVLESFQLFSQLSHIIFWLNSFVFLFDRLNLSIELLNLNIILALHGSNSDFHHLQISFQFIHRPVLVNLIFNCPIPIFFIFLFFVLHFNGQFSDPSLLCCFDFLLAVREDL